MIQVVAYGLGLIQKLGGIDAAKHVAEELLHVVEGRKSPEEVHALLLELDAKLVADIAEGNAARDEELHHKFDHSDPSSPK